MEIVEYRRIESAMERQVSIGRALLFDESVADRIFPCRLALI
jgi:hypothetical protein